MVVVLPSGSLVVPRTESNAAALCVISESSPTSLPASELCRQAPCSHELLMECTVAGHTDELR
jgi:hypothetical protein